LTLFVLVFELNRGWVLGPIMCDIWTSTDVLLCTSSILNFLVISIDRYFIINHPFKYAPMRKVKLLSFMIAGVWILSALVSLPPILGWGRTYHCLPLKHSLARHGQRKELGIRLVRLTVTLIHTARVHSLVTVLTWSEL
jgi:hypothetical protein